MHRKILQHREKRVYLLNPRLKVFKRTCQSPTTFSSGHNGMGSAPGSSIQNVRPTKGAVPLQRAMTTLKGQCRKQICSQLSCSSSGGGAPPCIPQLSCQSPLDTLQKLSQASGTTFLCHSTQLGKCHVFPLSVGTTGGTEDWERRKIKIYCPY